VLKKVGVFEAMRSHQRTNGSRLARARTLSRTLLSLVPLHKQLINHFTQSKHGSYPFIIDHLSTVSKVFSHHLSNRRFICCLTASPSQLRCTACAILTNGCLYTRLVMLLTQQSALVEPLFGWWNIQCRVLVKEVDRLHVDLEDLAWHDGEIL
jgi:hypothetical protein